MWKKITGMREKKEYLKDSETGARSWSYWEIEYALDYTRKKGYVLYIKYHTYVRHIPPDWKEVLCIYKYKEKRTSTNELLCERML